jgi:hypothetical protein
MLFKKIPLPLTLVLLVGAVLMVGPYVSPDIKSFFLFSSLLLKSLLLFVLPFIIFIYLVASLTSFEGNILKFIVGLLAAVSISNFLSTMVAYGLAQKGLPEISCGMDSSGIVLRPLWTWGFPSFISNEWALGSGFFVGLVLSIYPFKQALEFVEKGKYLASFFLDRLFIPLIPLFVLGFLFKMESEGILWNLIKTYCPIVLLLIGAYGVYLFFLYFVAANFSFPKAFAFIKTAFPAGLTGLSTMSSAAAMPLTLQGAETNSGQPALVRAIVPATVNIHLVGDSIGVPILAMAIMGTFGMPLPDLQTFLIFAMYFILAKFAIAAVPGGGIIVMIPVLEKYLGFTSEMSGLITALYMLFDPLFTSVNVMGNGAFSVLVSRIFGWKRS